MFSASKSGSAVAKDPYFPNVSLLLHGDGTNGAQNNTFLDSSTNNFTITRNGNVTQGSFSPYGSNWGNYFDGSSYLTTPSISAIGTGNFSHECWFYSTSNSGDTLLNDAGAGVGTFMFVNFSSGVVYGGINGSVVVGGSYTLPINQWCHLVFCRNGTTVSLFLNGTRIYTASSSANAGAGAYKIGSAADLTRKFTGYLSNVRFIDGSYAYDATQTTITVPTAPLTAITNTSLLTCQSNRFIDNSANNFALTVSGTPSVQRFSPFAPTSAYSTSVIGGSGYFDGTGDYLTVPYNSALEFGSGSFTIEFWANIAGGNSLYCWSADYHYGMTFNYGGATSNRVGVWASSNGSSWDIFNADPGGNGISTGTISLNAWTHVALVRNGSSWVLYINGVSAWTGTSSATITTRITDTFRIGGPWPGAGPSNINGYITDYRIVKGTAVYTANFTPPTAPLTAITNTSLLCNMTNGAIYDNAEMNDLETVGNAQISTSVKKYGTGSLYFDGTGDYLKSPATDILNFGTGDFTIECWAYFVNTADSGGLGVGLISYSGGGTTIYSSTNGGTTLSFYNGSIIVSGTISIGAWQHVALSRSSGTVKIFINGVQGGSAAHSSAVNFSAAYIGSQNSTGGFLNGYIDDLRITKGIARYTANFTPPTAAFPNQ